MKQIYIFILIGMSFLYAQNSFALNHLNTNDLRQGIIPDSYTTVVDPQGNVLQGTGLFEYVLGFLRDSIFAFMALIAIAVFLFIGWKLIIARGNPEEFKKAMMSFVYAAIGIFMVAFAWAAVKLVAWINI